MKSVLILAVVVLSATTLGAWLYYRVTREILCHKDRQQADRLATGLAVAAAPGLLDNDHQALQRLVNSMLNRSRVHSAAILDREGKTLVRVRSACESFPQAQVVSQPASLSYEQRLGSDFLEVGRPVLAGAKGAGRDALLGGIRLVLDTRSTARILAAVQRQVFFTAALIVVCAIPLGHLLVSRVLGVPIRRLVEATRRLAEGDWSARVESRRNDEIGELARSFDTMAERLYASRQQLRAANESLERKVVERTFELEQANRRLREEMAEKEDFLRAVSHDLNAPLRNIAGMATMITVKYRDALPEEALARLQRIQANVDAETDLIAELLELSQIKTRTQKRQMVDFGEMLDDLKASFEYELRQKDIVMAVRRPMPRLYVERNRIRQAFQNLIDNAIKYMGSREGGRIEAGYTAADGMHQFHVADNGPGIDRKDQERIFYVFRRIPTAANASVQGKGVGLALVRSIAQKYDGRTWVESEPGKGSVFHLAFSARLTQPPEEGKTDETVHTADAYVPIGGRAAG